MTESDDAARALAEAREMIVSGFFPRYTSAAKAIRDSVAGRVGVPGLRGESEALWPYQAAEILSVIASIAAVLTVAVGIVGVVEAVNHHLGGNVMWIRVGTVFAVAVWLSIAAGLALLVDIGRAVGASRTE